MANGQTVAGAPVDVVLVAADADRLGAYEDALRQAKIPTRATLDADEAESLVSDLSPDVMVLDRGLPRLTLFRLYGLVREDAGERPVQVVFVGQDGETGPGDHYLPGDPSPANVADQVTRLLASSSAATAAAPAEKSPPEQAAAPASQPDESARPAGQTEADAASPPPDLAASTSPVAAPETNGVSAEPDAAAAETPSRSGRRLDVILIRVGLALLILGALLIFIQADAYPPSLLTPGSAPATPTRRPTASPKPGAFLEGSGPLVTTVASLR